MLALIISLVGIGISISITILRKVNPNTTDFWFWILVFWPVALFKALFSKRRYK